MSESQRLMLVPGTFACSNLSYMSLDLSQERVLEKLEGYFAWGKEDNRVAGFNPWHFNNRKTPQHAPPCDMRLGAGAMPKVVAKLSEIGRWIQAAVPRPPSPCDCSGNGECTPSYIKGTRAHAVTCHCDDGWSGADCSSMSFLPAKPGSGFMAPPGSNTWGGSPIEGPRDGDGKVNSFYLFLSLIPNHVSGLPSVNTVVQIDMILCAQPPDCWCS